MQQQQKTVKRGAARIIERLVADCNIHRVNMWTWTHRNENVEEQSVTDDEDKHEKDCSAGPSSGHAFLQQLVAILVVCDHESGQQALHE